MNIFQKLMATSTLEHEFGLLILFGVVIFVAGYMGWSLFVRKKRMHRVAESDKELYMKHKKKYHDELLNVFSTTPQVIGEITGLSVATIILTVTLLMDMPLGSFEYNVTLLALVMLSISGISYLFSMEQLSTAMSPSIPDDEKFRLYAEGINLKAIGFVGLWGSVLVLLLLANVWAVLISSIFTCVLIYRHYEMRWVN